MTSGTARTLCVWLLLIVPAVVRSDPVDAEALDAEALDAGALDAGALDAEALAALLRPVTTLSAQFTQTVLGSRLEVLQSAEGQLNIERPGKFRWRIVAPYPQLIVTQGERLFVYDEDLAQVQVRPLEEAFDGTPARVLAGAVDALAEEFDVTRTGGSGDQSFRLTPRTDRAPYRELNLTFVKDVVQQIEVVDSLGQLTQVQLFNIRINETLDPEIFAFEIPAGVDVIGEVPTASP